LITADEFPGNAEQFASLDTDGSGGLDFEEAVAGFGRGDAGKARSMIAEMDADKDGMISWEEITGPKGSTFAHVRMSRAVSVVDDRDGAAARQARARTPDRQAPHTAAVAVTVCFVARCTRGQISMKPPTWLDHRQHG